MQFSEVKKNIGTFSDTDFFILVSKIILYWVPFKKYRFWKLDFSLKVKYGYNKKTKYHEEILTRVDKSQ